MDELMAMVFDAKRKDRVQCGGAARVKQPQSKLKQAVADTDVADALAQVCLQKF
jgi:hypothetical protein